MYRQAFVPMYGYNDKFKNSGDILTKPVKTVNGIKVFAYLADPREMRYVPLGSTDDERAARNSVLKKKYPDRTKRQIRKMAHKGVR